MSEARTIADIAAAERRSIAIGPFGSALRADRYTDQGIPVIRGQNITNAGTLDTTDLVFVSPETADEFPACIVREGDLVFPHRGAIGRVARVSQGEWLISSSMMKLTVNEEIADSRYVLLYFQDRGRRELLAYTSTVGTPGIAQPLSTLRSLQISLVPLAEQRAIVEVLGALDDKIAANTRLAATADQLAVQIYRSIEKEKFAPLSQLGVFVNGRAFTKGASGTGRMVVRIAELNNGPSGSTVYSDIETEEKHVAQAGDILFAWSGSLTTQRWFRADSIVNQHIFKVLPAPGIPQWLMFQLINGELQRFKSIAADKATTMGHIQRHHLDIEVSYPDAAVLGRVNARMEGLWNTALNAERESLLLAETRDALLPKLMSGQLRVRDAERIAEAAGA